MTASGFKTEMKQLGIRMKAIRKKRGLTLDQVHVLSGVTKSLLSQYENAKLPNIELYTLFLIAKAMEVTVSQLTDYGGVMP